MTDTKPKSADSLRVPGSKKKLGLAVPPALRMPHEDLIPAPNREDGTRPSLTSMSSQTRPTRIEAEPTSPVAPARDFSRVANSIVREAIPAGMFTGKSKQLYDCLYSLTRGALVPSRTVRISRPRLMKKARIGARVTFDANVERLVAAGLIEVRRIAGEHEGNEYAVLLPEEASVTSLPSLTSLTRYAQNLDRLVRLDSSQTSHTLNVEDTATSVESKTSFKTKTNTDDETALSDLGSILSEAAEKLTGRRPKASEREQWAELARTLVEELGKAAARAESVSNVPAFLNAHLRRKLAFKPVARKREASRKTNVGAPLAPPSNTVHRLTPDEIQSFTSTVVDLLGEGKSIEEVEQAYAPSMHVKDWATVKSVALAQGATKRGKP